MKESAFRVGQATEDERDEPEVYEYDLSDDDGDTDDNQQDDSNYGNHKISKIIINEKDHK